MPSRWWKPFARATRTEWAMREHCVRSMELQLAHLTVEHLED